MKLLILGGTMFLGRHIAEIALSRGHELSLFHRGQHGADLFPEAEHITGDRKESLDALEGRRWDAVIDTCGYVPRIVSNSAKLLAHNCDHYTFISSISVYSRNDIVGLDELGEVGTLEDPTIETIDGGSYGPLKALCEQAAEAAFPGRALNIRPGLIVGPNDPTDRFTYWPVRIARAGKVLVPADRDVPVQVIDVRDLASWTLDLIEQGVTGVFNATGPEYTLTLGAMIDACASAAGTVPKLVPAPEAWLEEKQVHAWSDIPVWVPDTEDMRGFSRIDCRKAIASGLTFRPIAQTAADTLAWANTREAGAPLKAGLAAEREAELIAELEAS